MEFIIIDGRRMTSIEATHEYLARTLRLPPYYGKNLDALHDCLTDLSRDVWIILINGDLMDEQLGDYAKKLRRVLTDVGNLPYACHFTEHLS
ncbi:MAG: barstar family protein [Clostridia bacterium]|nr:barstar family protein [Clostridia bacterium]